MGVASKSGPGSDLVGFTLLFPYVKRRLTCSSPDFFSSAVFITSPYFFSTWDAIIKVGVDIMHPW